MLRLSSGKNEQIKIKVRVASLILILESNVSSLRKKCNPTNHLFPFKPVGITIMAHGLLH